MVLPDTAWFRSAFAALIGQIGPETDQLILRARASGERWVAGVRLFLVAGLSVLVVAMAPAQRWTGLTLLLLVGLLHALLLAWLAFRVAEPWVPWLSCAADVALTSAALLFVLRHGLPGSALPTRSLYELYFLVIMSAGLRYDWRLCIWTAGLCIVAHTRCCSGSRQGRWVSRAPTSGWDAPTRRCTSRCSRSEASSWPRWRSGRSASG